MIQSKNISLLCMCITISVVTLENFVSDVNIVKENDILLKTLFQSSQYRRKTKFYGCSLSEISALRNLSIIHQSSVLAEESRCPRASWLTDMFPLGSQMENASLTGISVGCNTGIDAIGLSRLLSHNVNFSKSTWLSAMERISRRRLIAACRSLQTMRYGLHADLDEIFLPNEVIKRPITFHCIEPMASTNLALVRAANVLGLTEIGFEVHKYVISDSTGTVSFPRGKSGTEYLGAYACTDVLVRNCVPTKMLTLDAFAVKHLNPEGAIDILTIDAEGFDFRVLKGGPNTLRRTRYVEFEYHSSWKDVDTLRDAVSYMQRKHFVCYLAGNGRLFKISHGCWLENFEFRMWSNVVCVNEMEKTWLDITEKYFKDIFQ
jgi:FkbM family methyltransferase